MNHTIKINRARKISSTGQYPRTFEARLKVIPLSLIRDLTAKQIADVIDRPMESSYYAGISEGAAS